MKALNVKINSVNQNELMEMVRAFEPYIAFSDEADYTFTYTDVISEDKIVIVIGFTGKEDERIVYQLPSDHILNKKFSRRYGKNTIYKILKEYSGEWLPYGSLTGVRPTKLYYELLEEGDDADKILRETFDVTPKKIEHIRNITANQKDILNDNEDEVDIFVNVPFCPTRCAYCSFVAVSMKQLAKYLETYVECLKNEISIIKNVVFENNYKVRAIYFGGGTPTSIPVDMLRGLIRECDFDAKEFTVEAGRPDTVNKEMLDMLAAEGVTRISINPQTFHDKTLRLIGRAHTVEQTLAAYDLARKYPFIVNMDLITALPDESFDDFAYSLDKAVELAPENITVHNLSLKRGSVLTVSNYEPTNYKIACDMVDYSVKKLQNHGYRPYYMYRQKYNTGNLENSGYATPGNECIYNIDIMEENCSILAAGAGAISKRIYKSENRLERLADIKDVKGYIERFDEIEPRVKEFWKK